jgi:hypothetical protein
MMTIWIQLDMTAAFLSHLPRLPLSDPGWLFLNRFPALYK